MAMSGDPNLLHVATLVVIWVTWGTSLNIIWGYAGQFSMAQIGLGCLSAYTAAIIVQEYDWSIWPAAGVALLVTVSASLLIGLVSLRLSGFYFAIMTLAFTLLLLSFLRTLEVAGRSTGISTRFDFGTISLGPIEWDLSSRDGGFLALCVVVLSIFLLALGRLEVSRTGRALVTLREDPLLGTAVGVRVASHRLIAFVLSAIVAGVAGILYASYFRYISPDFFGFAALITMIVQLVVGGRGYRFGPLVGAFVYIGLTEWVRVGGDYREGLFGVLLILIVLFAPRGVLGTIAMLLRRRTRGVPASSALAPRAPIDESATGAMV
jgi:branched-chain amino acid transport system permease protein